ncbi:hypothetical protein [Williamsia sterculiae]|uniref:UvrABC system protein A n=1 Tax=Williamsia sterculiae TaxID=1344003 RepID=A0A1N7FD09_9NOCA|nr:hypothetical protein [Williamsia sterculiae]SIR98115.1 hypothetical protein SAMN05445060_1937 [Williamsia sterculiae]
MQRLNRLLQRLWDVGNTALVVEQNRQVIEIADHVVDMGPGAGADGGRMQFEGTPQAIRDSGTIAGRLLARPLHLRAEVREPHGAVTVRSARAHNLTGFDAEVPLVVLTAVTDLANERIVLDEPTSGLHPADVDRINTLFADLVDAGAKLVVVGHNLWVIAQADHIIDIGPGAGSDGGGLVFTGTPSRILNSSDSVTGRALAIACGRR